MKRFFYSLLALLVLMPCKATDYVRTSSGISFQTGQGVMQRMRVVSISRKECHRVLRSYHKYLHYHCVRRFIPI